MAWGRRKRARDELLWTLHAKIASIHADVIRRDAELLTVLTALADTNDRVRGRLEAERAEGREVLDAVTRLTEALVASTERLSALPVAPAVPATAPGPRVLGGSVFPASGATARPADVLSPGPPSFGECEVRFRFGGRWIDGFEVEDVIEDSGRVRYRLRRRWDGCVLPELFEAEYVRCFSPREPVIDLTAETLTAETPVDSA